jgi:phosphatidylserine decarboxylase
LKIAREALPFAATLLFASALGAWLVHPLALLPGGALLAFVLWFFRDPERRPPCDPELVISPADGRILQAGPRRVSIFMNVFDVHVCRAPCGGRVVGVERHRGQFLAAFHDRASEHNERVSISIDAGVAELRFVLVAGLVARRIVCKVAPGQTLAAGERVGLIRFGSRVDVDLPPGATVEVARGQRVIAGQTPIARRAGTPGERD